LTCTNVYLIYRLQALEPDSQHNGAIVHSTKRFSNSQIISSARGDRLAISKYLY